MATHNYKMPDLDILPSEIINYIYQILDEDIFKDNIKYVNKELRTKFEAMYKKEFLEYKYGYLEDIYGFNMTQVFNDTLAPEIENEKITKILGQNNCEYLMNIYDKEVDNYNIISWWNLKFATYEEDYNEEDYNEE